MQTAPSSSLPPGKPRNAAGPPNPLPPSIKHPQTPPKCVQPPPKEIKRIDDPKKCSTAFSKRQRCILKKASELFQLTGARVAVIMFSPKANKLHSFGKPSVEEVFSEYLGHNGCLKHLQTPPKCVQPPLKEIKRIHDPKKCSTTFSKRHRCIRNKAFELFQCTGAHVAVIMFSPKGNKPHCFGKPSVEEVFSEYLSHNGYLMLPMSQSQWMEECDSCATKEDCPLLKKLKDFENNPSVNAGAGDDSEVDRSSEVSNDDKSVDCDSFSTLLVDSDAGGGSSGVGLSDLEGYGYDDDEEIYGDLEDFIDLEDFVDLEYLDISP